MSGIYIDHLITRANHFWALGEPLPVDLYVSMTMAHIDIEAAERDFNLSQD